MEEIALVDSVAFVPSDVYIIYYLKAPRFNTQDISSYLSDISKYCDNSDHTLKEKLTREEDIDYTVRLLYQISDSTEVPLLQLHNNHANMNCFLPISCSIEEFTNKF